MTYGATIGQEFPVARNDDHLPAGQWLADGFKRLSPDDDVMSHRQFSEAFQVGGQSPRQPVFNANAAFFVHGCD